MIDSYALNVWKGIKHDFDFVHGDTLCHSTHIQVCGWTAEDICCGKNYTERQKKLITF